ncbi:hypothetical protein CCH79_00003426, partial [Gambusia affinis]
WMWRDKNFLSLPLCSSSPDVIKHRKREREKEREIERAAGRVVNCFSSSGFPVISPSTSSMTEPPSALSSPDVEVKSLQLDERPGQCASAHRPPRQKPFLLSPFALQQSKANPPEPSVSVMIPLMKSHFQLKHLDSCSG